MRKKIELVYFGSLSTRYCTTYLRIIEEDRIVIPKTILAGRDVYSNNQ